tara:strand:+ start:132 stop:527 length:396 start_codon:yes stop_codon:yes gene_type:complete
MLPKIDNQLFMYIISLLDNLAMNKYLPKIYTFIIIIINFIPSQSYQGQDRHEILEDFINDILAYVFSAIIGACSEKTKCTSILIPTIVTIFFITVLYIILTKNLNYICNSSIKIRRMFAIIYGYESGKNWS